VQFEISSDEMILGARDLLDKAPRRITSMRLNTFANAPVFSCNLLRAQCQLQVLRGLDQLTGRVSGNRGPLFACFQQGQPCPPRALSYEAHMNVCRVTP
jgi:hypothetical protein